MAYQAKFKRKFSSVEDKISRICKETGNARKLKILLSKNEDFDIHERRFVSSCIVASFRFLSVFF